MKKLFCGLKVSVRSYKYDAWTIKVHKTFFAFNDQDIRFLSGHHYVAHAGIVSLHDDVDRVRPGACGYASFDERYRAGAPKVSQKTPYFSD